jgi:hypothetical protein
MRFVTLFFIVRQNTFMYTSFATTMANEMKERQNEGRTNEIQHHTII